MAALKTDDTTRQDGATVGPPVAAVALEPHSPPPHPAPTGSRRGSERNPTEVTDEYEIYTRAPPSLVPPQEKYGKWLVFRYIDQLDETWHLIGRAVESGELGCSEASSSTMKFNPSKTGGGEHKKGVIRVFTSMEKMDEVGINLCRMVKHDVSYKTEEASKKGEYKHLQQDKNKRITMKTIYWNGGDPDLECKHGEHTPWSEVYRSDQSAPTATSSASRAVILQESSKQKQARRPGYVEGEPCFGRWTVKVDSDRVSEVWHRIKDEIEVGRLPAIKAECTEEMPVISVFTSETMVDNVGEQMLRSIIGTDVAIEYEVVALDCTPELRLKHSKTLELSPELKLVYQSLQQGGTGDRENTGTGKPENGKKKSEPKEEERDDEKEEKEKEEEEEKEKNVGAAYGWRQNEKREDEESKEVQDQIWRREKQAQERHAPVDLDEQRQVERQQKRPEKNQRRRSDGPESQSQLKADKEKVQLQILFPSSALQIPPAECHTSFIDPMEIIHCDSSGGIYHNSLHGITLRIPEGAIPSGKRLEISIGVGLCGDFGFPDGLSPVSAIVWLCSKTDSEAVFFEPVEVIIPHFMKCESEADSASLKMQFMKASHWSTSSPSQAVQFSPADGEADFTSVPNKGVLRTRHFCYLCISAGNLPEQLNGRRFCIACATPQSITTESSVYFYILYFLDTCIQSMENQLAPEYSVKELLRVFSFSDSALITGEYQCSADVTMTLQPSKISQDEIDFWKLHKKDELELREKKKLYPPCMKLTFGDLSSCEKQQVVTVRFGGTQEPSERTEIKIIIPSRRVYVRTSSSIPASPVQLKVEDKPTLKQLLHLAESSLRILDTLAPRWENLAIAIDFDPEGRHIDLIKKDCGTEGPVACCTQVLKDWLRGRGGVAPTWKNLLEILNDIEEHDLKKELQKLLSQA